MKFKDSDKKLNSAQSAFIQFFYDLSKFLLSKNYITIIKDKELKSISIYRNKKEKLEVKIIEFKYFNQYYLFQSILETTYPIIVGDRRNQRDINNRFYAFCFYAMDSIEKCDFIKMRKVDLEKWKNKSDISDKDKLIRLYQIKDEYNVEAEYRLYNDDDMRTYNILEFVWYSEEAEDMLYKFRDTIDADEKLKLYYELSLYVTSAELSDNRVKEINNLLKNKAIDDEKINILREQIEEYYKIDKSKRQVAKREEEKKHQRMEIKKSIYEIKILILNNLIESIKFEQLDDYEEVLKEMQNNIHSRTYNKDAYIKDIIELRNLIRERKNLSFIVEQELKDLKLDTREFYWNIKGHDRERLKLTVKAMEASKGYSKDIGSDLIAYLESIKSEDSSENEYIQNIIRTLNSLQKLYEYKLGKEARRLGTEYIVSKLHGTC